MSLQIEPELIQRCIKNEAKAQKQLYDLCKSQMYGVCVRYSNSSDDARDILQEGFIKIFSKINQYSGKGSVEGWMKRIFINCALEHYRVNKVYQAQSDVDTAWSVGFDSFSLEKISIKEILEVLNKMAPGYRTVLNLYAIEGYSHAEIADMLEINEGTSKSQLSRARKVFMEEYKKLNNNLVSGR